MALKKNIVREDGVTTSYHRIVRMDIMTNVRNFLEVASYVDNSSRQKQIQYEKEQEAMAKTKPSEREDINITPPYIHTSFYTIPYDQNMNIVGAYEYLKSLPEFDGAEDVLEKQ